MKIKFDSLQGLNPVMVESLAEGASEAGREALAGFLKKLIEVRFAQITEFAVPTSAPQARWSEQPDETQNIKNTKGK